jgi:hypothetical protein
MRRYDLRQQSTETLVFPLFRHCESPLWRVVVNLPIDGVADDAEDLLYVLALLLHVLLFHILKRGGPPTATRGQILL